MTEDEKRVADLGKPRLGDGHTRITVHIKESDEFKSVVDKLLHAGAGGANVVSSSSWREQFREALQVQSGDDDDGEGGEAKSPSCMDYIMHFLSLFWKVLFAFVPPTDIMGGWACFVVSIGMIGVLTAFVGDVASHFGCTVGLKDTVTAISFVAMGTSLPDTFASMVAAKQDAYADSSVGNVTGSNAVNVFLGIGMAWCIAAIYHAAHGTQFVVNPGSLAFSVTVFCCFAFAAISLMMVKRIQCCGGGELGGPPRFRLPVAMLFISLWVGYIVISSLESYCYIKGF